MLDSYAGVFIALVLALLSLLVVLGCARDAASVSPSPKQALDPPGGEQEQDRMSEQLQIRSSVIAGSWYPDDPSELARMADGFLDGGERGSCAQLPLALVAPHAGYVYSGAAAGQAFAQVRDCPVRRVWVLAPSHRLPLKGVGLYTDDAFRTPLGDLPLDHAVLDRLARHDGFDWLRSGDGGEHSLEIELPILQRALGAFELVPLLLGRFDDGTARSIAEVLRQELGPGDLLVISTDFTHYGTRFGYAPFAGSSDLRTRIDDLDHGAWKHVAEPDPERLYAYLQQTGATICGRSGLLVLAALLGPQGRASELVYTSSGAMTGDWANSVSYLAGRADGAPWSGRGPQTGVARLVSAETGALLLELAERSLQHWFEEGSLLEVDPSTLPSDASTVLGAFVTLQKGDRLRGCIGEITATRPAWQAVIARAVDAAVHDPRFSPVTASELPSLHLDISLLGPSRKVAGPRSVIVGRHGVVLSRGTRRATYLPQVGPEQGWDRNTMLAHLARKAGLPPDAVAEAQIEVYEAQVIREPD